MIKIQTTGLTDRGELTALVKSGKDDIDLGREYWLEDATAGTLAQNKFFHKLLEEWELSGCHSYGDDLRRQVKYNLGQGIGEYLYWNGTKWTPVKTKDEIPAEIRRDRSKCFSHLKSWSDYTLPQRRKCIKKVIQAMIDSGVNSKTFDSICKQFYDA